MSSEIVLPRKKSAGVCAKVGDAASATIIHARQKTPRNHPLDWRAKDILVIARCLYIPFLHMSFRCRPYLAAAVIEISSARRFRFAKTPRQAGEASQHSPFAPAEA